MKKNLFFGAMALVALASSCGQDGSNETVINPEVEKIPIQIATNIATRVTDASFESGDKVGVYVVNQENGNSGALASSGNHVDNMGFTYTTKWTADNEIYWKDQTTKADFYVYYPYNASVSTTAYIFSTKTDQSTLAGYKASELLWGKTVAASPTDGIVSITMDHSLSNVLVYLNPGKGFTAESLAASTVSVKICNVKTDASLNIATGNVTATGAATMVTPYNEGNYYRALIVPQTVDEKALIVVTVDGVSYTLTQGFTFAANTQHKFTVTLNKANSGVNIGIGNWTVDEMNHGGTAE